MALYAWSHPLDPVSRLLDLQRDFERVFGNSPGLNLGVSGRGVFPPVNIFAQKDGYVVRVEVPGIAPDQLSIETQGRTLTVSGKREIAAPSGGGFHRRERRSGQFSRSLQLPEDLDLSRAQASYQLGIVTIRVPTREEAKPRQVTVNAG